MTEYLDRNEQLRLVLSTALDMHLLAGGDLNEAVATCIGTLQGKMEYLGHHRKSQAIEAAHNLYLEECS
jgi:hypothetical protein